MYFSKANTRDLIFSYVLPVIFVALPSLIYIIYRASHLSFTHDESLSFFIANGDTIYAQTPNNHLLNTGLMRISGSMFGHSVFSMRLPNILAFVMYCVAGLLIIKDIKKPEISIFLFAILVLNSFMLEFFGLARGYGLAMGLLMLSFFFFMKLNIQTLSIRTYTIFLLLTLLFSQFALYANFNALNVHLALLPVLMFSVIQFGKRNINLQNKRTIIILFPAIFVIDILALIPAILRLKFMESNNDLAVFGDHNGLLQTTVRSLINSFYHHQQDSPIAFTMIYWSSIGFFAIGCILFVRNLYRKDFNNFTRIFSVFCLFLLAPVLQDVIFNIPYPYSRTAILYFPVLYLVLIFLYSELFTASKNILIKVSLITILVGVSAFSVYAAYTKRNFTNTTEWAYDMHDKDMLELIAKDRMFCRNPDSVTISNYWIFTPSINFYRVTKNYEWLKPVIKEDYKRADYYICNNSDRDKIPGDSLQLIKSFDDIAVSLYKEYTPK